CNNEPFKQKTMKRIGLILLVLFGFTFMAHSQKIKDNIGLGKHGEVKNMREYDKNGLNVFEPVKDTTHSSKDVFVRMGGAFALQFQNLHHKNSGAVGSPTDNALYDIGNNFNLATANLEIDVRLYDG